MKHNTVEAIDTAISEYMAANDCGNTQMAALMKMTTNTLRSKRNGSSDWSWSEILKLADLTGKSPDQLAGLSA